MKLTIDNSFKPVTIILETQDELDQMYGLSFVTELYSELPLFRDISDKLLHSTEGCDKDGKYYDIVKNLLK